MLFNSPSFLIFFLPGVLILGYLFRRTPAQNILLFASSLFFYAWGELAYVLILLGSIALNYAFGLWIDGARDQPRQPWVLALALAINLSILAYFKYANFAVDTISALLSPIGLSAIEVEPVHLPIGISFFTFQAMTYVVDVYRQNAKVDRSPLRVGLYIAFFPQLIAGPIVRYRSVAAQLLERHASPEDVAVGIRRFVVGLGKKVLIADQLAVTSDRIFALPAAGLDPAVAWLGVICFGLQVYFDFSGYSDMAIGLGRVFGFHFPENFNAPFVSRSLQEFWRRWHISLSGWFRDYLYVPLTAGRESAGWGYFSLFVVFFLCGLWHGANWNFVAWGLVHGAFVALERTRFGDWLAGAPKSVAHGYTLLVVFVAFVFFRAEDLPHALDFLAAMLGHSGDYSAQAPVALYFDREVGLWLAVGVAFSGAWMPGARRYLHDWTGAVGYASARVVVLAFVFAASCVSLVGGTNSPFVYFRF
jgi:alginate O-acetyltransferase complex protein AlgI